MIKVTKLASALRVSADEINKIGYRLSCRKFVNRKGEEYYSFKNAKIIMMHFIKATQLNVGVDFLINTLLYKKEK